MNGFNELVGLIERREAAVIGARKASGTHSLRASNILDTYQRQSIHTLLPSVFSITVAEVDIWIGFGFIRLFCPVADW